MIQRLIAGTLFLLLSSSAFATGLFLAPRGVKPLARGGAFIAGANDVNALSYNPAGIALSPEMLTIDFGLPLHSSTYTRYVDEPSTAFEPVDGQGLTLPSPTIGGVLRFAELPDWTFAGGIFADYPGLQNWPDTLESGRAAPQRYSILNYDGTAIAKLSVAAAWSPVDDLSFGLQAIMYSGRFANTVTLSNCDGVICTQPENPDYDSAIQVTSDPLFLPGLALGIQYGWNWGRLGMAFETGYSIDTATTVRTRLPAAELYDDAVLIPEVPRGRVSFELPMALRAGFEVFPVEDFAIEFALVWENWSVHDVIVLDASGASITEIVALGDYELGAVEIDRRLEDTLSLRLGTEVGPDFHSVKDLTFRLGFAYEPSASPDDYLSAMAVDLDKYIVGSGVAYSLDAYTLEFTYALVLMTDREITNSNLQQTSAARPPWNGRSIIGNGKYEGSAHILGLGVHYNL